MLAEEGAQAGAGGSVHGVVAGAGEPAAEFLAGVQLDHPQIEGGGFLDGFGDGELAERVGLHTQFPPGRGGTQTGGEKYGKQSHGRVLSRTGGRGAG